MIKTVPLSIDAGRLCHVRINILSGEATVSLLSEQPLLLRQLSAGEQTFSFDPAYYTVYHGVKDFVLEIDADTDAVGELHVWQDEIHAPAQDRSIGLTAPFVWPRRTLLMGNSLLQGFGTYGMCASDPEHDFCFHIASALRAERPDAVIDKMSIAGLECSESLTQVRDWMNGPLLEALNAQPELVLIQCGDNVNNPERQAVYRTACAETLEFVRRTLPDAQVALIGEWYPTKEKQTLMAEACRRTGCAFVDIEGLRNASTMGKIGDCYLLPDGTQGVIDSEGVASHPNNAGMAAIARKIIDVLGMRKA